MAEAAGPFERALDAAASLYVAAGALRASREETLGLLTRALGDISQRRRALLLLSYLDPDYALDLAGPLTEIALSHRDALLVRQIFGRLRRDQAEAVVPPSVWRLLAGESDDEDYRRMAELLYHLGLTGALRELSERALASDDPNMREVGAEYSPDDGENG